jgi:hypothetical protein
MTTNDSIETAAIATAKARRADARTKCNATKTAADLAQHMTDETLRNVAALERNVADTHARKGLELAAQIAAGGTSVDLAVPHDDAAAVLATARVRAAVTAEALKSLRHAHETAVAELRAAEAAVGAEADRILNVQADALAAEVERAFDHLIALGDRLREYAPDQLNARLGFELPVASPRVLAALDRIPQALDGLNTPVNQLRGMVNSPRPLAERRTALIADRPTSERITDSVEG